MTDAIKNAENKLQKFAHYPNLEGVAVALNFLDLEQLIKAAKDAELLKAQCEAHSNDANRFMIEAARYKAALENIATPRLGDKVQQAMAQDALQPPDNQR